MMKGQHGAPHNVGRLGVSSRSHMYYHSLSAACHSDDPDRGERIQPIRCQIVILQGPRTWSLSVI